MILIIADDLSGAAELAGLAAARGYSAQVQTAFNPSPAAEVIALDTDTRSCSAQEAAGRIREALQIAKHFAPAWIYKKTDSVLRGRVRAELSSLLAATNSSRVLLIPANPARGRLIRDGAYFVHGKPLNETVFANDPEYPATTAGVRTLLSRDGGADIHLIGRARELPRGGIAVPDIEGPEDLADRVSSLPENTLCAGAAEFFAALLATRSPGPRGSRRVPIGVPAGRALFVCGSAAAWPARRDECPARGLPVFSLLPEAIAAAQGKESWAMTRGWIETIERQVGERGGAVLAIGEPSGAVSPTELLAALCHVVFRILDRTRLDQLFLEGGATAAAVIRAMAWTRLEVVGHLTPDLAWFQAADGKSPWLAIKPGSYAWPEEVWGR
ncbi:MAG: four-carbon acid sugar kinase family protein [Verrucomicrobiota bacterium]